MSRTLTLPKKGSGLWTEGWHTMKINKAEYGDWNGTKYLDLWFDGYSENFNMRVYEKISKNGEEFNEKDVIYYKGRAESFFSKWIEPKLKDEPVEEVVAETSDIPF